MKHGIHLPSITTIVSTERNYFAGVRGYEIFEPKQRVKTIPVQKINMIFSPVDNWLDEKRRLDGAEGLWRIHNKLYDFTIWSRIHPGGKFWLDISQGTDITEAFESHHFSEKAERELQNYYRREAKTPRKSSTIFRENDFYKKFKRKVAQQKLTTVNKNSLVPYINDGLAAAVYLTSILGAKYGFVWVAVCGTLLGVLTSFSHSFFHMKDNWRVFYFNLSLMSSREWRVRHVLSHHQYRNTFLDLEISVWRPFSRNQKRPIDFIGLGINCLYLPFAAHVQFFQRVFDLFFSRKLGFHREELIPFTLPMFMFFFSGLHPWEVFITWNLIIFMGSFTFCLSNSSFLKQGGVPEAENFERKNDFGTAQLLYFGSRPKVNGSVLSFFNSFRGNVLHYLCPILSCENLGKLISVFEETVNEFGVSDWERSKGFLDGLHEGKLQRGHLFFS